MDVTVFKEECERVLKRFKDLDKEMLNLVWKEIKEEPNSYITKVVSDIFRFKIPGQDTITRDDFTLKIESPLKQAVIAPPEVSWLREGLHKELKKRGAKSLWDAVVKARRETNKGKA